MEQDLSPDDVAILIRAQRIQKEKGIKATSVVIFVRPLVFPERQVTSGPRDMKRNSRINNGP